MAEVHLLVTLPYALRQRAEGIFGEPIEDLPTQRHGIYRCDAEVVSNSLCAFLWRAPVQPVLRALTKPPGQALDTIYYATRYRVERRAITAWAAGVEAMDYTKFYREQLCVVCELDVLSEGGRHAPRCPVGNIDMLR